jgi:hypothetical protein
MIKPENLEWGQTPFDDMTRDEMLHELKTQFNAIMAASAALHVLSWHDKDSPFWQYHGTGGRAKMQIDSVTERVNNGSDDGLEAISGCYFRYADQLLFPELAGRDEWSINGEGQMITGDPAHVPAVWGWNMDWRKITLDDLKPKPD